MPAVEMFRMLGSGTESVIAAIRVARLATGKRRVVKIGGAYHGWWDQLVYSLKVPNTKRYEAHGIPAACTRQTDEARPNDLDSLERVLAFNRLRGGTACVLIEPVGPESGTRPVAMDYNKGVRELCDKYGALLVFDEVVTAFRIGLGGAQGYFGVRPDLTTFGKIVAGGYPSAGGLGGRRDLIMLMAAGLETGKKRAYVGGTMAANPLSAAAGYFTLREIEKRDACAVAGRAGDRLAAGLQGPDRGARPALRRLQPGLHRPPRDRGRHVLRARPSPRSADSSARPRRASILWRSTARPTRRRAS